MAGEEPSQDAEEGDDDSTLTGNAESGADGSEGTDYDPEGDTEEASGTAESEDGPDGASDADGDAGPVGGIADGYDEDVVAEADALVEEMARAEAAVEGDTGARGPDRDDEGRPTSEMARPDMAARPPASEPDDEGDAADAEAAAEEMEGESTPLTGDPDTAETGWPGMTGPDEDREMPLADHVEEMLKRLAVVVAVAGVVSLLVLPFGERIINFLWYSILPGVETDIARPRLYSVLELWFTRIKVASLAGLVVALPVVVYEAYAFMRPGLYPHERRYYLAAVPTSLVLAVVGVSFAYFVILPAIFVYFLYYSQDVATIGFALGRTFDLILLLMGYMALVFQIPLFLMLAMMMNLVTRRWLAERRILFWGAFLGISFVFSPDPTGMAPIIVAATMIVLFEGTLLLTKWTGRG